MRRKLAAGNWKMNGTATSLSEIRILADAYSAPSCEILICPPATLLARMAEAVGTAPIRLGGQDCHPNASGAHTGDISAGMLKDAGASHVIVGHSERRADHAEDDALVCAKAGAAYGSALVAVICVGETETERDAGDTLKVIGTQLAGSVPDGATADNTVIAYEPVWAIGTGKVPTVAQIAEVHNDLRNSLIQRFGGETANAIRLLYGGSVKASNADDIFAVAHVDGALVGGASLKAADFAPITAALDAS